MKSLKNHISFSTIALSLLLIISGCGLNVDLAKRYHQPGFYFNVSFDNNKQVAIDRQNIEINELKMNPAPGLRNSSKVVVSKKPELRKEVITASVTPSLPNLNAINTDKNIKPEVKVINRDFYASTVPFILNSFSISNVETTFETSKTQRAGKSQLIALLLVIFLGYLGIHRFYLGYTLIGIIQLFTGGGFGIWWIIDLIRIVVGDLQPKDGTYTDTL